ncbi:MAG: MBL fold metallo-hydrolase [Anaerolineae bacterium]|nr:MBL fold metallo-hydrolase [Anaerolineae bacterium]
MLRERVADDIYVFTSEIYAQVTAGAVVTSDGAILIDTLVFPSEAREIRSFLEGRLNCPVRYVINTHYHADHTYGTCFFPEALVVSHDLCRQLLDTRGRAALASARSNTPDLAAVEIVLPTVVFDQGCLNLHLGNKTVSMWHAPGHSPDGTVCLVEDDRVLFASDIIMPVPYFVDGGYEDFIASLHALKNQGFENIVQGHGEVILRGEIEDKIDDDLRYLAEVHKHALAALEAKDPDAYLESVTIESCGKSRIPLNGVVQTLHRNNLRARYEQLKAAAPHPVKG